MITIIHLYHDFCYIISTTIMYKHDEEIAMVALNESFSIVCRPIIS